MNCFHSITGGDIRDDILQLQIDNLDYSLSIDDNKLTLKSKDNHVISSVDLPITEQTKIVSMELKDESIILTLSDNTTITCSLHDIYSKIDTKQNEINDLDIIRQGAQKGSTAVQPKVLEDSLSNYITHDDLDETSKTLNGKLSSYPINDCFMITGIQSYDPYIELGKDVEFIDESPTIGKKLANIDSYSANVSNLTNDTNVSIIKSTVPGTGLDCSDTNLFGIWLYCGIADNITVSVQLSSYAMKESDIWTAGWEFVKTPADETQHKLYIGWHFYKLNVELYDVPTNDGLNYTSIINEGLSTVAFDKTKINKLEVLINKQNTASGLFRVSQAGKITSSVNNEFFDQAVTDRHINDLIDAKLGAIKNGS